MNIDILTLFPGMFKGPLQESIIKRATDRKLVQIKIYNIRDFADNKSYKVDDYPYGGGPGMVLRPESIFEATERLLPGHVILMTPDGYLFNQKKALELSRLKHLIFICGHYGGVDERVRELIDSEISIGDYVLTGGELPALVVIDAVIRTIPGVLGNPSSLSSDSFYYNILGYPQYTRPRDFRGMKVPEILLSGNHQHIKEWRKKKAMERTLERRPYLLKGAKDD
ncbi:MAG: tRNA (guanosine(37)-N1)-methyltransferase TrmD [bacterium]|nr:tRNA (guanosine(37)-N1)-methyltransferase TrmD [bacterium]